MVALTTPTVALGAAAPDFALPDPDGKIWRRDDLVGKNGLLVMFISNHCPYVQAIADKIARDTKSLRAHGISSVAIMANDIVRYPDDAPPKMKLFAAEHGFTFPYLFDETQAVAKAYGAVCTPDFFGYNKSLQLQYRGRLDASGVKKELPDAERELYNAMKQIAYTGATELPQHPSIGCSIKWRD